MKFGRLATYYSVQSQLGASIEQGVCVRLRVPAPRFIRPQSWRDDTSKRRSLSGPSIGTLDGCLTNLSNSLSQITHNTERMKHRT